MSHPSESDDCRNDMEAFFAQIMSQKAPTECPDCEGAGCVECDGPAHRCTQQPKEATE